MDCKKIGEYIQRKRREAGMTQVELGNKLGVTSKAVSKWECGVALPDVSLFSDLASVLEIDILDLLNGEDNKKDLNEKNKNILIIFLLIFLVLLICLCLFLSTFFINNYNKVHIYDLSSERNDFYVDGKVIITGDKNYLFISKIRFVSKEETDLIYISNYDYEVYYNDRFLFKSDLNSKLNSKNIDDISLKNFLNSICFFIDLDDDFRLNKNSYFSLRLNYSIGESDDVVYDVKLLLN